MSSTNSCRSSYIYSTKRKLEDYVSAVPEDDGAADYAAAVADLPSSSWASTSQSSSSSNYLLAHPSQLQFFVRMLSDNKTISIRACPCDTVKSVHEKIRKITGIPLREQRLIYLGKQLQWEKSLAQCAIENDASLQLVGRLRSTGHPKAWKIMEDVRSIIGRLYRGETVRYALQTIKTCLSEYVSKTPKNNFETAQEHLQIFISSLAPSALIMLYMSPIEDNMKIAEESIRHFLHLTKATLPKQYHSICVPTVMEFCNLLRGVPQCLPLYTSCRTCVSSLLKNIGHSHTSSSIDSVATLVLVKGILPFISEIADRFVPFNTESAVDLGILQSDVNDFSVFVSCIYNAIKEHPGFLGEISVALPRKASYYPNLVEVARDLYQIFDNMLLKMELCLNQIEEQLNSNSAGEGGMFHQQSSQYLAILKELNVMSGIYVGCKERFWAMMRLRKRPLCALILRYVKRTDDHWWLLERKDVIDLEAKRHMVMMMFPEVVDDFDEQNEILIDRSQLLTESFNYVSMVDPESLHGSLFVEFKNEEATGPGVEREWFYLVCQALFSQHNDLFIACPNDCSRFYPNPASKPDPLSLKYFKFAGRMIALALRHKVQVGIVLDRIFFRQLAGLEVDLEDIREADPCLYSSCRKILELDSEVIDSDALGLTFVREVEELGSRKVIDLLPGGANIAVNSKNREEYVHLLVKNQFVSSISEQVSHFKEGFVDILSSPRMLDYFFQSLDLEDLDLMLRGSTSDICVQAWRAHTEYIGYKETDLQIVWFWEIVETMTPKQKHELLFFWTSIKNIPVEGFCGLSSTLQICSSPAPITHLPTTHTCFYRLCLPVYPSMAVMLDRLLIVVQEHVVSSFGTW
ncbi:hypothetical protein SAY86_029931 [Trapa natans]|uniref:HECT-type E3 ubiquitin transferase n=1 Tax=Trapa natans TaxID=22666 RepID=A0AAN7MJN5_TRANT|nr:hypothetical protein SAY86_029931 [Trapa natans]